MAGRCSASPPVDSGAKTLKNHGSCDDVDADGNHVYVKWDSPVQAMAAVSEGTGEWIGGTGTFAGLSGSMTIRPRRLNAPTDGAAQVVGDKRGSDSLTDTAASAKPD